MRSGSASIYKFASKLTWLAFICLVALLLDRAAVLLLLAVTSAGRVTAFPAGFDAFGPCESAAPVSI
jgi:hypothetical protein